MIKQKLIIIVVLLSLIPYSFQADICTKCENGDCTMETEECSTGCIDTFKRNSWSNYNKLCNCNYNYYHTNFGQSEYSCKQCPEKCSTCYDTNEEQSTCKTCQGFFRKPPECDCDYSYAVMNYNGFCECKYNFFQNRDENGVDEDFCTQCPDKCNGCKYDLNFQVVECNQCKDTNKKWQKPNICTDCKEGLKKDGDDLCTICIADENKKQPYCTDCKEGLEKDRYNLCTICIADKNKKAPECFQCKEGLEKDGDDLCTICIGDQNKKQPYCTDCKEGFKKDGDDLCNICIADENKKIPNCTECKEGLKKDGDDLCTICIADENKKLPDCTECKEGFKKDGNGICNQCSDENKKLIYCTDCEEEFKKDDDGNCTLCIDDNKQLPSCNYCKYEMKKDADGNCTLCNDSNKLKPSCTDCKDEFKKNEDGNCTLCSDSNKVRPSCTNCKYGFKKDVNGNCTLCSDNNKQLPSCIFCKDGFKKNDNGDCTLCSDENEKLPECNDCKDGFKRNGNGDCTLCSDNNKKLPDCTDCKEGFKKDGNGICNLCSDENKVTPECTDCKVGFQKNEQGLCQKINESQQQEDGEVTQAKPITANCWEGLNGLNQGVITQNVDIISGEYQISLLYSNGFLLDLSCFEQKIIIGQEEILSFITNDSTGVVFNLESNNLEQNYSGCSTDSEANTYCKIELNIYWNSIEQHQYSFLLYSNLLTHEIKFDSINKTEETGIDISNPQNIQKEVNFCTDFTCSQFLETQIFKRNEEFYFQLSLTQPENQSKILEHFKLDLGGFQVPISNDSVNASIPGKIIYRVTVPLALGEISMKIIVRVNEPSGGRRRFLESTDYGLEEQVKVFIMSEEQFQEFQSQQMLISEQQKQQELKRLEEEKQQQKLEQNKIDQKNQENTILAILISSLITAFVTSIIGFAIFKIFSKNKNYDQKPKISKNQVSPISSFNEEDQSVINGMEISNNKLNTINTQNFSTVEQPIKKEKIEIRNNNRTIKLQPINHKAKINISQNSQGPNFNDFSQV